MANKILNQPSGAGFLGDLTKKVKGELGTVVKSVEGAVGQAEADVGKALGAVKSEVGTVTQDVKQVANAIDQFVQHPGSIKSGFSIPNIPVGTLNEVRNVLDKVLPHHIEDSAGQKFIQDTQDFRGTLKSVNDLSAQLAGMSPTDPRYGQVKQQLAAAEGHLSSTYGYTQKTAPKPGTLWVEPRLMRETDSIAQLNSRNLPTGTPVTAPPNPMDVVFQNGRSFTLTDSSGKPLTVKTPDEYRAVVAQNRAAAGIPTEDGNPMGVHVSFEGGGGKGKRYGPSIQEMYREGVVPASVTGTSAGAIAAGLVAGGADPAEIDRFMKDPVISKFYDLDIRPDDGGLMDGQVAYDTFDQELRKLTGIKDRPVTFADLKMPLQIVATKMSDTQLPPGQEDLTQAKNRTFVFSQETTPNTPVALAMRASMSIPAAFDPVKMVDPTSGREVMLVDGGVLDNLPMDYNHDNLPSIGLSLASRGDLLPSQHNVQNRPLPGGNLDATHVFWNALNGYTLLKDANGTEDYLKRTQPKAGQFMLSLPDWDLTNPDNSDSTMGFGYDPKIDPALDAQTRQVTQNFLRQHLGDFGKPGASGTNVPTQLPDNFQFSTDLQAHGQTFKATYTGGDVVSFTSGSQKYDVNIGQQKVQAMYLDNLAFGDLGSQLGKSLNDYLGWALKPGARLA